MSHTPNELDVKTDLRRSVMASFSPKAFEDINTKTFLKKAEKNLEAIRDRVDKELYKEAEARIKKAKDPKSPIQKRREDLLTASYFI